MATTTTNSAKTYTQIAWTQLGSATSSITMSSIPSTYTDLRVVLTTTYSGATNTYAFTRFNGDTATNYSYRTLYGYNGSPWSENYQNTTSFSAKSTGDNTYPQIYTYDILQYASTSYYKTTLYSQSSDYNSTTGIVGNFVSLWRSTAAINSISFTTQTGNFSAGTTVAIYGITAA